MKTIKTESGDFVGRSCEGCAFLHQLPGLSPKCEAGRLEKFIERGEVLPSIGNRAPLINRYCNLYRDYDWRRRNPGDMGLKVNSAKIEAEHRFFIVVDAADKGTKFAWQALEYIKKLDYPRKKIGVIISGYIGTDVDTLVHETNVMVQAGIPTNLVLCNPQASLQEREHDIFSKAEGWYTHVVLLEDSPIIPKDALLRVNNLLNEDLEKTLYVLFKDAGIHCISFDMMNSTYLKYNSTEVMADNMIEELTETGMYTIL